MDQIRAKTTILWAKTASKEGAFI